MQAHGTEEAGPSLGLYFTLKGKWKELAVGRLLLDETRFTIILTVWGGTSLWQGL